LLDSGVFEDTMHHVITCPVDYSEGSRRALRYAAALAPQLNAIVNVLHVVDPLLVTASAIHQVDVLGREAEAELRAFAEQDISKAVRAEYTVLRGSSDKVIARQASDRRARLIVMGTHGLSGIRRAFFGSTTRGVLRLTAIPVLAVPFPRSGQAELERPLIGAGPVLVPVDFGGSSSATVRSGAELARALGRSLVLLHVRTDHTASDVEAWLTGLAAAVGALPVQTVVVAGDPAGEIAACAGEQDAAVIVMALSDAGAAAGSVTYQVLCRTSVPVLAIPKTPVVLPRPWQQPAQSICVAR